MTDDELRATAEACAGALNSIDPAAIPEWLVEVAADCPYWDARTNLLSLLAERTEDLCLVLASPGGR